MYCVRLIAAVPLTIAFLGCQPVGSGYRGPLSQPEEAQVDASDSTLNNFDSESRRTLFRYLAGNTRWEIRQERGIKYAVRREKIEGKYETTLNGFYSHHDRDSVRQTRVILSFDEPYGFGIDRGNITRVKAGAGEVNLIIEGTHWGSPGNSSYLIVQGDGVFLEIFDQAPEVDRTFTKAAIADVCAELLEVQEHRDEINSTGLMAVTSRYADKLAATFTVADGDEKGIYQLNAAVNPTDSGFIYAKVFDTKSGRRLSEKPLTPRSTRHVGWSKGGKTFFPYNAEVTVYEGDWSTQYEARFELWHHPDQGPETKIAETTRMINGWER